LTDFAVVLRGDKRKVDEKCGDLTFVILKKKYFEVTHNETPNNVNSKLHGFDEGEASMTEMDLSKNNRPGHHENHHETTTTDRQHNERNSRNLESTHSDKSHRPSIRYENNK
jgi:hypothetical protein